MNTSGLLTTDKKSIFVIAGMIDSITAVRSIFYMISLAVLLELGLSESLLGSLQLNSLLAPLLYFCMGIIAATIANSTGAGGGIVFLPIFMGLGFTPMESLSTSIAIQCFGMSSGSLAWISYRNKEPGQFSQQWQGFTGFLIVSAGSACIGVISSQRWMPSPPMDIEFIFAFFSLAIGSIILVCTIKVKTAPVGRTHKLSPIECASMGLISFIGGCVTAWISIGVGELLLIFLILRGIRINVAVATAVCVSAISVLIAMPYHIALDSVNIDVLLYAAPGALIGGVIARGLATYLGTHKLKVAASGWIILSSIPYLIASIW